MITFTVLTDNPDEIVNWFTEQGHRQVWCSKGYTYAGIYKRWRIDNNNLYYHRYGQTWNVRIRDKELAVLFALRWA